eukprot:TRINITY_DN2_c1_g2_i1.p1 TRINITY_DN2_c1_g2~~TRINITY_DN2_c1_g2_i1.p1  ORF type:complete len:53 (-),score=6.93 TRINITY_DN2_c1_g2_i1:163-321(-)
MKFFSSMNRRTKNSRGIATTPRTVVEGVKERRKKKQVVRSTVGRRGVVTNRK